MIQVDASPCRGPEKALGLASMPPLSGSDSAKVKANRLMPVGRGVHGRTGAPHSIGMHRIIYTICELLFYYESAQGYQYKFKAGTGQPPSHWFALLGGEVAKKKNTVTDIISFLK
jgi:hypothetical protein